MSQLMDQYYSRHDVPPTDPAKQIAFDILSDVTDRRGWSQTWGEFDASIREDILKSWIEKINKTLRKKNARSPKSKT